MAVTYYTVANLAAGDPLPETWVDQAKANLDGMIVRPACRVYNSAALTIGNATWTALTMNSERFDTDGMHSTSVNTARITIATTGIYQLSGNFTWDINASESRAIRLNLNGGTIIAQDQRQTVTTASNGVGCSISCIYALTAGDYVTLDAFQNSGGNLNVVNVGNYSPEFSAVWLGRTTAP